MENEDIVLADLDKDLDEAKWHSVAESVGKIKSLAEKYQITPIDVWSYAERKLTKKMYHVDSVEINPTDKMLSWALYLFSALPIFAIVTGWHASSAEIVKSIIWLICFSLCGLSMRKHPAWVLSVANKAKGVLAVMLSSFTFLYPIAEKYPERKSFSLLADVLWTGIFLLAVMWALLSITLLEYKLEKRKQEDLPIQHSILISAGQMLKND
ncbi:hypothetical protein [Propionimicrobium lymphophilum]|uniref:hypothetical protein n=1 Tax=Propionimicrobium lymphophilum TaxID=33012 RepID=UPI0023EFD61C|nr:hypothetical protein [Propionimicrobium lymphophilum]